MNFSFKDLNIFPSDPLEQWFEVQWTSSSVFSMSSTWVHHQHWPSIDGFFHITMRLWHIFKGRSCEIFEVFNLVFTPKDNHLRSRNAESLSESSYLVLCQSKMIKRLNFHRRVKWSFHYSNWIIVWSVSHLSHWTLYCLFKTKLIFTILRILIIESN